MMERAAKLIAVGSANPRSVESFQQPKRSAFRGRCIAVLRSTGKPGKVVLTAKSKGLKPASVEVEAVEH